MLSRIILFMAVLAASSRADNNTVSAGLLKNIRQLTLAGRRAGEGYFSADGRLLVFQSEREPQNPFFQIYLMDLRTGTLRRLSPGHGRATCAWLHPDGRRALFSSTHADPLIAQKQAAEFERRRRDTGRRSHWVYDEYYDIYEVEIATGRLTNLTKQRGYDAEGSYSPDGRTILFASNRLAYQQPLPPDRQRQFERDPSVAMDLYLMDADGSHPRRLTTAWGQDGGPFFSADGRRIVWRRFTPDGLQAEIWVMNADGSGARQITHLGVMSWAPFFHPSGEYIIFTTNLHGFDNFELYIVDATGRHEPVRVTELPGFDGLPVFSPDGRRLSWTSNRTANHQGQIFIADWDHQLARYLLGLSRQRPRPSRPESGFATPAKKTSPAIRPADISRHVHQLASQELGGRLTGSPGEMQAAQYLAARFAQFGLQPAGTTGFFQPFDFVRGVEPGPANSLVGPGPTTWQRGRDWQPLAYSANGQVTADRVVFAGYGIASPAEGRNDWQGITVKGHWVMLLRDLPAGLDQQARLRLAPWADLRRKVSEAKARGAAGVLVATPPEAGFNHDLIELQQRGSSGRAGLVALAVSRRLADTLLRQTGKDLATLAQECDRPRASCGQVLEPGLLRARVDLRELPGQGRNVLARLASSHPDRPPLLIGAHYDHIGTGVGLGSLARPEERGRVHPGADDNASGTALVLELAEWLAAEVRAGRLVLERDIVFAAWSGEELGLLGSGHYVKRLRATGAVLPAAAINLDMVGRLRGRLILYGRESSPRWSWLLERANAGLGLPLKVQTESVLPTDATSFVLARVPVLSAFTGLHDEYNTPRDRPGTLNYSGAARIGELLARVAAELAASKTAPPYREPRRPPPRSGGGHGRRVALGTVPDFSALDVPGVKLAGVRPGSPAARAGLRAGDVVVELAGQKIENLYDYARAISALKVGAPARLVITRQGQRLEVEVIPESRQ